MTMNLLKKSAITVVGTILVLIGVLFIILPGPAVLFIPLGLALLSLEYPWAKKWLRKAQRYMKTGAEKLDTMIRHRR